MGVVINTNMPSLAAQRNLNHAQSMLMNSFTRLSSGYRINSSKDDAAGMAISTGLTMNIRSYFVAERNANDAVSAAQIAEGAFTAISDIVGRMRELSVQSANGSYSSTDRGYLATEFTSLQSEIKRVMSTTKFAGTKLVSAASTIVDFQVGIKNTVDDRIKLTFGGLKITTLLSVSTKISTTAANAQAAIGTVDTALDKIATIRAKFGAIMNRLEMTSQNIQTERINVTAANSRIRDVDVAEETSQLARQQVLVQAGSAILAQANQAPQLALSLVRGQ